MKTLKIFITPILIFINVITVNNVTYAQNTNKPTFVLVAGAWHGGWCWRKVSAKLRSEGAVVYTPSLSGLAEHKNTLNTSINLDTHIQDIINLIIMEDLHNVILVGHSYSGTVITGVADRIPERLSKLVYLDAMIVQNGQSAFTIQLPKDKVALLKGAKATHILSVAAPPITVYGVTDTVDVKWGNARLTPHPWKCYTEKLVLHHPFGNHLPKYYIACTNPMLPIIQGFTKNIIGNKEWHYSTLKSAHDAMIIVPDEVSERLMSITNN